MSDNRQIIFVPVDPQTYGLGMALGCLIKFWPVFVIIGLIIYGISFLWQVGSAVVAYPENIRQTSVVATNAVIYQATQITREALLETGISNLQRYRGEISLPNNQVSINNEYFKINSVIFADNGIKISFDSASSTGQWRNAPDRSCIIWQSNASTSDVVDSNYWNTSGGGLLITQGLLMHAIANEITSERLGNTDPNVIESGLTVYHYEGYLLFPYTVLPNDTRLLKDDTAYYFSYGCAVSNPQIVLFDILDFSH